MKKTLLLLLLIAIISSINADEEVKIPLTMLNGYESAKCLDGSYGGYYKYFSSSKETKFVIELQGGGECATLTQCTEKLNTNLGSSTKFEKTLTSMNFLNDLDSKRNPVFSTYNHVFIPYVLPQTENLTHSLGHTQTHTHTHTHTNTHTHTYKHTRM